MLHTVTSLSVIDPCNRTGKIDIPATSVTETKGVTDWLRYAGNPPPDAKDLSLCLLFQRGRCNAGARCNQVHADPSFIEEVRSRALAAKSCCARHGDVHSSSMSAQLRVAVTGDAQPKLYDLYDFAATENLEAARLRARDGIVRITANRICRLHQKGSCKFGRDCKNIHLCPSAVAQSDARVAQPASVAPKPAPLGLAFRALNLSVVDTAPKVLPSEESSTTQSIFGPCPLSIISGIEEFNSIRKDTVGELDPLDILDGSSSFSELSARDFDAFVDALVESGPEPLASPNWLPR